MGNDDDDDKELKHKWLAKEVPCSGDKSTNKWQSLPFSLRSQGTKMAIFNKRRNNITATRMITANTSPTHENFKNESVNYGGLKIEAPQHK